MSSKKKFADQINFCDIDRYEPLAFFGDSFARVGDLFTTDCACCTGFRILVAIVASFAFGAAVL